mmetsp:Transcript_60075/g.135141  ORF Transcript_60075/g.135141 Transcript_60075/m.135141 type:complete len:278 (+) Transcript_60075:26-859(+)
MMANAEVGWNTNMDHSVRLTYAGKVDLEFGWSEQMATVDFAKRLREAVKTATGLEATAGLELQVSVPGDSAPRSVTPRDIFERRLGEGAVVSIVVVDESLLVRAPAPAPVLAPSQQMAALVPPVQPARRTDKKGGSQIQFQRMLNDCKNPLAHIPEGTRLTPDEVARHKKCQDCWIVYEGRVYDVTAYMDYHPGGRGELMKGAGKDCTELYMKAHPWVNIDGLIGRLCIGKLVAAPATHSAAQATRPDSGGRPDTVQEQPPRGVNYYTSASSAVPSP